MEEWLEKNEYSVERDYTYMRYSVRYKGEEFVFVRKCDIGWIYKLCLQHKRDIEIRKLLE